MNKKKNTRKPTLLLGILSASFVILISIMTLPSWNTSNTEDSSTATKPNTETEYHNGLTEQNTEIADNSDSTEQDSEITNNHDSTEKDSEITDNSDSTEQGTEITDNSDSTEQSTETAVTKPRSYLEWCELDYVEPPVKRTREEAIEKIKDMSWQFPALYYVYENADAYPDELLLSGAGNPEMTDFLYGYIRREASATGGISEDELPENYPLFLQWDIRWGYMPYGSANIGATGCGPTCLSMAVFYLTGNRECTPDAVAQYSLDNGHYIQNVGTAWALLSEYPKEYGLTSMQIRLSEENLKKQLDKGNILICSVRPGNFTSEGHFIVIYGYDENGFKVNDPKCVYRSRLSWTYEQIKDDIKATWSIGK